MVGIMRYATGMTPGFEGKGKMKRAHFILGTLAVIEIACGEPCTIDLDCSAGNVCVDGRCEKAGGDGGAERDTGSSAVVPTDTGTDTAETDTGSFQGSGGIISASSEDTESDTETSYSEYHGRCDLVFFCIEYTAPAWTPQLTVEDCDALLGYYDASKRCDRGPICTGMCIVPGELGHTMFYHDDGPTEPDGCLALDGEFHQSCSEATGTDF